MKRSLIFYLAMGLIMLSIVNTKCKQKEKKFDYRPTVVVNMDGSWLKYDSSDIWWKQDSFVTTAVDTSNEIRFTTGYTIPADTLYGLRNYYPVVVIVGDDTTRHYFRDTVRVDAYQPIHLMSGTYASHIDTIPNWIIIDTAKIKWGKIKFENFSEQVIYDNGQLLARKHNGKWEISNCEKAIECLLRMQKLISDERDSMYYELNKPKDIPQGLIFALKN